MPRKARTKAAEDAPQPIGEAVGQVLDQAQAGTGEKDIFDEQAELREQERQAAITAPPPEHPVNEPDEPQQSAPRSHAAAVGKKTYTPPADPFGFEGISGEGNRVHLLKSEGHGAWVIRFDTPPNEMQGPSGETYSKENPHPVIKYLKSEGYRWGFDEGDGKGGWGKRFEGDPYGNDHIQARKVLQKAAEMIGAPQEQEIER